MEDYGKCREEWFREIWEELSVENDFSVLYNMDADMLCELVKLVME